jgi:8-oxo-dGTP pyrophosphatase MutT (NUDIX family)
MFSSEGRVASRGLSRARRETRVHPVRLGYHRRVQEAAGYIVYVAEASGPRFLLLRNASHHTWGFPKGRLEEGEDARAGALRELREETGITRIHVDDGFEAESVYEVKPGRGSDEDEPSMKRARYFLARVEGRDFTRSDEHDAADWMRPEEAVAALRHEDLRRIFREALARVRGQSKAR